MVIQRIVIGLYATGIVQTKIAYSFSLKIFKERDDSSDLVANGRMLMSGISDKQCVGFGSGF
jgi:hypothetical protein